MGEAGLGWIPYVSERLDRERHRYGAKIQDHKLRMPPSEIFARQVFTTYEDGKLGVELSTVTCENAARVYGFRA